MNATKIQNKINSIFDKSNYNENNIADYDAVLTKISTYYEEETLTRMQRILGAIEPTLVIFFSLMVGLILLSVIMPLIGIMSSIG